MSTGTHHYVPHRSQRVSTLQPRFALLHLNHDKQQRSHAIQHQPASSSIRILSSLPSTLLYTTMDQHPSTAIDTFASTMASLTTRPATNHHHHTLHDHIHTVIPTQKIPHQALVSLISRHKVSNELPHRFLQHFSVRRTQRTYNSNSTIEKNTTFPAWIRSHAYSHQATIGAYLMRSWFSLTPAHRFRSKRNRSKIALLFSFSEDEAAANLCRGSNTPPRCTNASLKIDQFGPSAL